MSNDKLIHHGSRYDLIDAVAFAQNTHETRVREKIQEKIQVFCIAKSRREIKLTIDDEAGRALYDACTWSSEEHDRVLSKATKV